MQYSLPWKRLEYFWQYWTTAGVSFLSQPGWLQWICSVSVCSAWVLLILSVVLLCWCSRQYSLPPKRLLCFWQYWMTAWLSFSWQLECSQYSSCTGSVSDLWLAGGAFCCKAACWCSRQYILPLKRSWLCRHSNASFSLIACPQAWQFVNKGWWV